MLLLNNLAKAYQKHHTILNDTFQEKAGSFL